MARGGGNGLLIGAGVVGGAGLLYLAFRQRDKVASAAQAVTSATRSAAQAVASTARKGAKLVAQKVTGLDQWKLDRIAKHDLARLVEKYRDGIPFGVAMAIMEHESKFDPTIYNYRDEKNVLQVGHYAGPGTRKGGGANGLYQIMSHLIGKGYDAPSVESLFDPETNIRAALKTLNRSVSKYITPHVPSASGPLLAGMVYLMHAEGGGALVGTKNNTGAFSNLKRLKQAVTWENILALPWGKDGMIPIKNKLGGIAEVAGRAAIWELAKPSLLGQAPAAPADPRKLLEQEWAAEKAAPHDSVLDTFVPLLVASTPVAPEVFTRLVEAAGKANLVRTQAALLANADLIEVK